MKKLLFAAFVAMAFAFTACDKDDNQIEEPSKVLNDPGYDLTGTANTKTFVLGGNIPSFIREVIDLRFPNKASGMDDAGLIFVHSSEKNASNAALDAALGRGAIVVEVNPLTANNLWVAKFGDNSYKFSNPLLNIVESPVLDPNEQATPSTEDDPTVPEEDQKSIEAGETCDFLNIFMSPFVDWVKDCRVINAAPSTALNEFESEISKFLADARFTQTEHLDYKWSVKDYQFAHVASSKPDKVTRNGRSELKLTITPIYAYECNGTTSGDYYFVTLSLIAHNADSFGKYYTRHGAIRTLAYIFYSKRIGFGAHMVTSDLKEISGLEFFHTPSPESSQASGSHSVGFSGGLNVSGNGGLEAGLPAIGLTVGGTFTWSTSDSKTFTDIAIEMSTDANRKVSYNYVTNNLMKDNNYERAVPALARTDEECLGSWCWHVPGTKDYSDTGYKMIIDVDMLYGYMYRHGTWGAEGHIREQHMLSRKDTITIKHPNRNLMGVLQFKSTSDLYIDSLTFVSSTGEFYSGAALPMERNAIQNFQLPCGQYKVRFSKNTGEPGGWRGRFENEGWIEIKPAENTDFSSLNGTKRIY